MGNISLLQAFLCGIIYWLAVGNLPFVGLWTLQRPLVCGFVVGMILGDPVKGAIVGGSINLVYLGFMSAGGSMPADMSLSGILGTAYAICGGLSTKTALALAVPIGLLGTVIWTSRMTFDSVFVHQVDKYIENEEYHKIFRGNVLYPQIFCALITVVPCTLAVYLGSDHIGNLVASMDGRLLNVLQVIGGLLPCLGIAITLLYIFEAEAKVFLFIGFILASYTDIPMHIMGVMALLMAIVYVQLQKDEYKKEESEYEGSENQGDSLKKRQLLPKKAIIKSWLIWETFPQTCYNYERMMGQQMAYMFSGLVKYLYPNDRGKQKELMKRECEFFNTHVEFGACIPGMAIALEEQKALGADIPDALIKGLKTSFMGSLASIGDTVWQGVFLPVMLVFCIDFTKSGNGNMWGAIVYIVVIFVSAYLLSYYNFMFGYHMGENAIIEFLERGIVKKILKVSSIMGCMVMGGLIVKYVTCTCGLVVRTSNAVYNIQEQLFDSICPNILALAMTMYTYYLLKKKGWNSTKMIVLITAIGIIGGLTGLLIH